MFNSIRNTIKIFHLQKIATRFIQASTIFKRNYIIQREGILYRVDLTKTIDFGIFRGGWEPTTIKFLKEILTPGATVIEVGANIGAHSLLIASTIGKNGTLWAIEPTLFANKKLKENISLNTQINNINIIETLISNNCSDLVDISINSDWSLNGAQSPEVFANKPVITIDVLVSTNSINALNLLKVDVDGFDLKVLQGARDTLKNLKPIIYCELCEYALNANGDSIDGIFDLLEGLGYKCFSEVDRSPITASLAKMIVGQDKSINGIFLHP